VLTCCMLGSLCHAPLLCPIAQEAMRLQHLRHGHVVNFYGVSLDDSGRGIIVMEFCEGKWH